MSSHTQTASLVVIGGGITGLSAALTWALTKDTSTQPVVLIEKQPHTGGYVTSYERSGYLFDTCQMLPNIDELLSFFGIDLEMRTFDGYYARIIIANTRLGRTRVIELPSGVDAFSDALQKRYPHNARQLARFFAHSRAMFEELFELKVEPTPLELVRTIFRCPKIVRNGSVTFQRYFDRFGITDPEAREIFDVFAAFSGLPADRVTAIVPISAMNSLLDGAFRPRDGFRELPRALEARLRELGGEVRTGTAVESILVDDGRVRGVELANGETILAENVVTTIDPMVTMNRFLGLDLLQQLDAKYAEKAKHVQMSTSSMNISLGLDDEIDLAGLGLDCGYNVITSGGTSFSRLFDDFEQDRLGLSEDTFHLGVICPSLTTGGKPNITIRVVPMPLADWAELRANDRQQYVERKEALADLVVGLVERYLIPDLRAHVKVRDVSTPATYARYSGSPTGAIYDMAPTPDNFGRTRLKMRTPVQGLYQPKFVHGVFGSLLGGMQAIDMITNRAVMNGNARLAKELSPDSR